MLAASLAALAMTPSVRVMSYNIWVGGTRSQPLSQTVRVLKESNADIIGIQEPGENLIPLARQTGLRVAREAAILTRYRVLESWDVPGARWGGARLRTPDGREIWAYNTHLTAYPYGPYEVRDGKAKTEAEAIEVERAAGRLPEVQAMLADIRRRVPKDAAVVFTGDFNAPSHRDWARPTERTFNLAVAWPVSRAVEQAGFVDTYRRVHRDVQKKRGFTWSPGYPVPNLEPNDVMDRIDFVYARGRGLRVQDAIVVAETGPFTDLAIDPWPSDHRAVLAVVSWR
ncbi:MAG: endonuclease/exonuclease/phosphatase family protein [Fimbriimonadaceae bacterium]|nr:endonuclease/exonuclease/phosphatase family protein [Fimbriimonadaceae bacterium]